MKRKRTKAWLVALLVMVLFAALAGILTACDDDNGTPDGPVEVTVPIPE
jgi:hypothetical protein